jgi:hypothetical protein
MSDFMSAILASEKELTAFYMGTPVISQLDACGSSSTSLRWHNGSSALPIVGDVVWVTEGKSTLVNPVANSWSPMSPQTDSTAFDTVQFDFSNAGLVATVMGCSTVTAVSMSSIGRTTSLLACGEVVTTTRYISGGNTFANNGEIVYIDSGGTTIFNGAGKWYRISNDAFIVSSLGVISSLTFCGFPPD